MNPPILETRNVVKCFGGITALKGVSFELRAGEVHAICGENGAGKSTLIKILSGVHPARSYEGEVRIDGDPAPLTTVRDAERLGISVIYQELALVGEMTVGENIFLGNEPRWLGLGIDWLAVQRRSRELLKRVGLDVDPQTKVRDLGVGRQQLVEIAKALGKKSRILILDEPTAALADQETQTLLELIRELKGAGLSIIYISHKLDEVFAIADRITVLRDGQSIVTVDARDTDERKIIRQMVGREITDLFPRRSTTMGDVLLSVRDLTVADERGAIVLENIAFDVRAGEVIGIGGLMGAGRTELLLHLFGFFGKRLSGQVRLLGQQLTGHDPHEAIERGLALVSEDRKRYGLVLDQSISFNLSLASLARVAGGGLIDADREFVRNQRMFDSLMIKAPDAEARTGSLSGGNQQKVVIGKALLSEPKVVFLDEPTRGIDVGAKLEVYALINRLTDDGCAVVLVSSELPELMGMSDRIVMLHEGAIGGRFDERGATPEALMAAAMGRA